jgi:hypothetical protein
VGGTRCHSDISKLENILRFVLDKGTTLKSKRQGGQPI